MESTAEPFRDGDEVRLRVPARAESLVVARTLAAAVASQWGFTLDVVEDARLLTSELLTLVLQERPGSMTELTFGIDRESLRVRLHTDETVPVPQPDSFGWLVLSEISSDLQLSSDDSGLTVSAALAPSGNAG